MNHSLRIKICGITHQSSLDASMGLGAHFCGFVFHPGSPRYISPERAALLQSVHIKRVGVFVRQQVDEIIEIMSTARLDFAQLHGLQSIDCAKKIGPERIIRVLWPSQYTSQSDLEEDMDRYADSCAWFLLDAGHQRQGGCGITLDWKSLYGLRCRRPWFLAGGLSSTTLPLALSFCNPNGVDLNSGVEWSPGHKSASSMLSTFHSIYTSISQPSLYSL